MNRVPTKARAAQKARGRARKVRARKVRARKGGKPAAPQSKARPLDAYIAAGARALDLKIDRRWTAEVRAHLAVTLRHGAAVAEFDLPDDSEPAPVFEA